MRENTVRFIERLGKLQRVLKPGLHFYMPGVEVSSPSISLKEQIAEVEHQRVITRDNVEIGIDGNFFYRIEDPEKAYYNALDYRSAIQSLATSVARAEIGRRSLDDVFQQRQQLNEDIRSAVNGASEQWGLICSAFEVLRVDPPTEVKTALREVASAERIRRKDIILSEADKEYNEVVVRAYREARLIVLAAEREGEQLVNSSDVEGLSSLSHSIEDDPTKGQAIDYILKEREQKVLADIVDKQNICVIPEGEGTESSVSAIALAAVIGMKSQVPTSIPQNTTAPSPLSPTTVIPESNNEQNKQEDIQEENEEQQQDEYIGLKKSANKASLFD